MSIEFIATLLGGGEIGTLGDVKAFVAQAERWELGDDTKVSGQLFLQMVGDPEVAGGFSNPARVLFVPGQPDEGEVVEEQLPGVWE